MREKTKGKIVILLGENTNIDRVYLEGLRAQRLVLRYELYGFLRLRLWDFLGFITKNMLN